MFRKKKIEKKEEVVKVIENCSFCKTRNSVGKVGKFYYCSDNICATRLHNKINKENNYKRA